jgi:glycosyltransferase involved in cell wall biosynthesis
MRLRMKFAENKGDFEPDVSPATSVSGASRETASGPRRLRVLISAFACEPYQGSEPEVGWQWAAQMARFHDVTVLTQGKNRANIERALEELRPDQSLPKFIYFDRAKWLQKLRRRPAGLRIYCLLWHRSARHLIRKLHSANRFELMHHVTIAGFRSPTAIWARTVCTVWGPVGGIENFPLQLLPLQHLPTVLHEITRNLHNQVQLLPFNSLSRRVDSMTVTLASTREMQIAFEKLGYAVRVMPTIGLRTCEIPFQPRVPRSGPLKLLFVGNLIALKGVHLAIEALAASGTKATLTLIGSGYLRAAMEKRAGRLGISSRVKFRGRVPREEVIKSYQEFDALLFPCIHDTGGYAGIEAMCQELPVICLDAGGPAIAVQEGSGIKVPIGSRSEVIAGLAAAIRRYDQDRRLLLEHGRNARQVVLRNYDWDKKGEQLSAIYEEAVAKWNSRTDG